MHWFQLPAKEYNLLIHSHYLQLYMPQGYLREFSLHLSVYLSLSLCSGFVLSLLLFLERRLYQIVRSVSKLILTLNRKHRIHSFSMNHLALHLIQADCLFVSLLELCRLQSAWHSLGEPSQVFSNSQSL